MLRRKYQYDNNSYEEKDLFLAIYQFCLFFQKLKYITLLCEIKKFLK